LTVKSADKIVHTLVPLLYMASMQGMWKVCPHLVNLPTVLGWRVWEHSAGTS